jgi:hypothetical protein
MTLDLSSCCCSVSLDANCRLLGERSDWAKVLIDDFKITFLE